MSLNVIFRKNKDNEIILSLGVGIYFNTFDFENFAIISGL